MKRTACAASLTFSLLWTAASLAASASTPAGATSTQASSSTPADAEKEARRAEARTLAQQGDTAFSAGRCDRAVPLWRQAEGRFHAPTILLRIARCQALLGQVVEATTTFDQITAEELGVNAPPAFVDAQKNAVHEGLAVRSRIATLRVEIDTAGVVTSPIISVDDVSASAGQRTFLLNPGKHLVRVHASNDTWEKIIQFEDGDRSTVQVRLALETPSPPHHTQRLVGLALGGVGLASMVAGSIFGYSAYRTSSSLSDVCGVDRKHCPSGRSDDIGQLKTNSLVTDLTMGGGVALLISGIVVVVTEPKSKQEEPLVHILPLGLGAQVRGAFLYAHPAPG